MNPKITFPLKGQNLREVERLEAEALSQIMQALHDNKDDVAAILIEPIQGEGGDNHFRAEFFKALRRICDESEVFLILDEVQTGVGLTGKMWCYQHFGIEPDAIAFGKKTQVCGCLVSARVDEVENNCFKESSRINSTWGGTTVDMVRSSQFLKVIDRERLVDRAATLGRDALAHLVRMQEENPAIFTNARGRGLFLAVDLVEPQRRPAILKKAFELGMLVLPTGTRGIRLRPSLVVTQGEMEQAIDRLARAAREVGAARPVIAV